jgi:hypothetical protein
MKSQPFQRSVQYSRRLVDGQISSIVPMSYRGRGHSRNMIERGSYPPGHHRRRRGLP